jgi:hypothetical protein
VEHAREFAGGEHRGEIVHTSLSAARLPAFDGCYVGSLEGAAVGVSFFEEPVTRRMSSTGGVEATPL